MAERVSEASPPQPEWRREPYRLLFPLGVVLGGTGMVHWLLYAVGVTMQWRSTFHALALVQGFLLCFALGFLFTFIPRRTGTVGPSAVQLGASLVLPVLLTASAWVEAWLWSQLFFLAQLGVLLGFVVPRVRQPAPGRSVPEGMVWVPVALVTGAVGSLLTTVAPVGVPGLHGLGTGLLLQGLFTCLVLGVGGMLLPMFLHGQPPGVASGPERRWRLGLHLGAALLFVASFPLEAWGLPRMGHALRAAVAAAVLVGPVRLWRPPSQGGMHRWLIWGSAWLLPLGYLLVALRPELRVTGLHVVFVGCFALMTLAVSVHVVLAHGGHGPLLSRYPWQVVTMGVLLLAALVARLLMSLAPAHLWLWLGCAAGAFLLALLLWVLFLGPLARREPSPY
ncbi:NnrS family protein [Archangium lansingense]|uniref:NnrS family protein n=1 Tax=Archangium lansingense TaxID=2995310 RepID=UPI003B7EFA36